MARDDVGKKARREKKRKKKRRRVKKGQTERELQPSIVHSERNVGEEMEKEKEKKKGKSKGGHTAPL